MKRYDLLTPEGTRDLLFDECVALRAADAKLRGIFLSRGYTEAVTPGLEFYDVFSSKSRYFSQEEMYKLTDAKGRLMVMRPDSTMPIARLVGTRLREEVFPLKLFYSQTIYRVNPKNSGRDDEFFQSGIEIIGGDVRRSDLEALSVAIDVMAAFEAEDYRFEIGDSAFFAILSSQLGLNEEQLDEVRTLVQNKNYCELSECLSVHCGNPYATALAQLPKLFGGREVFDEAEKILPDENTKFVLKRLRELYDNLCALGAGERVTVDLGMVSRNEDYYTGVVFKGYAAGYGMPVLTGGRYDKLISDFGVDMPATGFAVNVNAVARLIMNNAQGRLTKLPDVAVFAEEDSLVEGMLHCRELISDGLTADHADFKTLDEAKAYAEERGIPRLDVVSGGDVTIMNLSDGKEE